jgi:hypothetical protein
LDYTTDYRADYRSNGLFEVTIGVEFPLSSPRSTVVVEAWGQFWNPDEGERPPLEALTRGLAKRQQIEKTQCSEL